MSTDGVHASVKAIQDMEAACARFSRAVVDRLPEIERELRQVSEELDERRSRLRREIADLEEQISSADEDDDKSSEMQRTEDAEDELASVSRRIRQLEEVSAHYTRHEHNAEHLATAVTVGMREFLIGAADDLRAYLAKDNLTGSGSGALSGGNSFRTSVQPKPTTTVTTRDSRLVDALRTQEGILAKRADTEKLIVFDPLGNVLFEQEGEKDNVQIPGHAFPLFKDAVVSHNHPRGYSFSSVDLRTATELDMAEVRAVGVAQQFTYSLSRPVSGWPPNMAERYLAIRRIILKENTERIIRGELKHDLAVKIEAHSIMQRLADEMNLNYEKAQRT